jgi:hypothetical protein
MRKMEKRNYSLVLSLTVIAVLSRHFTRLCGTNAVNVPLSVYGHIQTWCTTLITPKVVEKHMRLIASRVYQLHPTKDKQALLK